MGLFVQRPEEPSEWAGLPGEPRRPHSRAEMLPDHDASGASATTSLGFGDVGVSSISVPVTPVAEAPSPGE